MRKIDRVFEEFGRKLSHSELHPDIQGGHVDKDGKEWVLRVLINGSHEDLPTHLDGIRIVYEYSGIIEAQ